MDLSSPQNLQYQSSRDTFIFSVIVDGKRKIDCEVTEEVLPPLSKGGFIEEKDILDNFEKNWEPLKEVIKDRISSDGFEGDGSIFIRSR